LGICVDLRWQVLRQNCEVACQLSTAGRITHSQSGGRIVAYTAFCHLFSCLSTHKLVGPWQRAGGRIRAGMEATRHEKKDEGQTESNQPKIVLRLPDLEHAKSAVLNSLTSVSQAMRGGDPTVMLSMSSSIGIVQNLGLLSIER
jgi:hypothetical protein